ncbi:hypothetical protein [Echinicola marina]
MGNYNGDANDFMAAPNITFKSTTVPAVPPDEPLIIPSTRLALSRRMTLNSSKKAVFKSSQFALKILLAFKEESIYGFTEIFELGRYLRQLGWKRWLYSWYP